MSVIRVMGRTGDAETHWTTDDPQSIELAKEAFRKMTKHGFATEWDPEARMMTKVTDFNPAADEIVVIPQVAGG